MDQPDNITELEQTPLITNQPQQQSYQLQYPQYDNNVILDDTKNSTARIKQHINKIISIISKQYNQLGYVDLIIWTNHYYYSNPNCILEYCYDWCCCINYNPEYYFSDTKKGYGQCCGINIFQSNTFYLGSIMCCVPYLLFFPICILDCWYKKCYGYSRTGIPESIGNSILECCICQCWEKWFYLNIHMDEIQNVFEIIKNMYSGILDIEIKKYSTNWCIKIKSK